MSEEGSEVEQQIAVVRSTANRLMVSAVLGGLFGLSNGLHIGASVQSAFPEATVWVRLGCSAAALVSLVALIWWLWCSWPRPGK